MCALFLSHTWKRDQMQRNTHERVARVKDELSKLGVPAWLDEEELAGDIDHCMALGIDRAEVVVVFLTRAYCLKVEGAAASPWAHDNCYKEFSYAQAARKPTLPVVFEECMLDVTAWPPGVVKMRFASKMYVDGSVVDAEEIARRIVQASGSLLAPPSKRVPVSPASLPARPAVGRPHPAALLVPRRLAPILSALHWAHAAEGAPSRSGASAKTRKSVGTARPTPICA